MTQVGLDNNGWVEEELYQGSNFPTRIVVSSKKKKTFSLNLKAVINANSKIDIVINLSHPCFHLLLPAKLVFPNMSCGDRS